MLRWRETRRTRTSGILATRATRLVDRKRKPPKKVLLLHSTLANTKISWLALLAIAMFLRLVQKRFFGSAKKDGILLV